MLRFCGGWTRFGILWIVIGLLVMRKDDLRHLAFDPLNFMFGKLRKKLIVLSFFECDMIYKIRKTTLRRESTFFTFQETRRKILGGQN